MQNPISTDPDVIERETYFEYIPISKMFVAPYGRNSSKTIVHRLTQNFNIDAVGVLYLSYREATDTYAIIDGHHRMLAATHCGYSVLPARIYLGLTYEQEANLYNLFATVNKQNALDRFKARLAARDPEAIKINDFIESIGLRVGFSGAKEGEVRAISVIEAIIKQTNFELFESTIQLIFDAYRLESGAYVGDIVRGVAAFLDRYQSFPNYDRERTVSILQKHTPRSLQAKTAVLKGMLTKSTSAIAVGVYIMEEYNSGLRNPKNKLPAWKTYKYTKSKAKPKPTTENQVL